MQFEITNENVPQLIAAMHQNVKSNQHRLDLIEPVLNQMSGQVTKMNTMLIDNGFLKAVENNARDTAEIRKALTVFNSTREETCPFTKRTEAERKRMTDNRDWGLRVALAVVSVAGFGLSFYIGILMGG